SCLAASIRVSGVLGETSSAAACRRRAPSRAAGSHRAPGRPGDPSSTAAGLVVRAFREAGTRAGLAVRAFRAAAGPAAVSAAARSRAPAQAAGPSEGTAGAKRPSPREPGFLQSARACLALLAG